MMKELFVYLNPVARLGIRKYSIFFPLFVSLGICLLSESYCYFIVKNPLAVGMYIIFVHVALVIYFAFRDAIRGGIIATIIAILYYFYIIATRHYTGQNLAGGIDTTFLLACIYLLLALIIGWLKRIIDELLGSEKDARRLAEEERVRLQTVLQQLPVGVMMVDRDTLEIKANRQMEKIIGRKVKPSLEQNKTYKSASFYYRQKPLIQSDWPLVKAIKKGQITSGKEIEFVEDGKKHLYLRVNAAPIKNKHNKIIAAVSTIDDVSSERDLEQRKDDFVNMASHELKTPLTSMKLYIDALLKQAKKYDDEKLFKMVISIKRQTNNLQELAGDLLDLSRIQTGKLFLHKETFNLKDLIDETIDMMQGANNGHQIFFRGEKSFLLFADRFRIGQVLTNLLTNAIKYSPENSEIIIQAKKEKGGIIVSVQDFGIGISKIAQKKIFERLYQVRDPHEKTFPGLGMGLYISKEVIKKHKGTIWVSGEKGKGSIFYFSLPFTKRK